MTGTTDLLLHEAIRAWLSLDDETRITGITFKGGGTVEVTITGRSTPELQQAAFGATFPTIRLEFPQ